MSTDASLSDTSSECSNEDIGRYFKIAIDFGTTCSSVAYLDTHDSPEPHPSRIVGPNEIKLVTGFPDSAENRNDWQDQKRVSVPSQCWYGPKTKATLKRKRRLSDSDKRSRGGDRLIQSFLLNESKRTYQWGYGVQDQINNHDPQKTQGVYVENSKLYLDNSKETEELRSILRSRIKSLRDMRAIKNNLEPITGYLTQLLKYTRKYLEKEANFNENCQVEFVVCVPAAWNAQATMRMQRIVETAIRRSAFLKRNSPSERNLFMISEPEAASICVLESNRSRFKADDTFIVLDAGGGTVDACCYSVVGKTPPRLKSEETMAEGALCGSSYLNLELRRLLENKLKATDFEQPSLDLDQIIEKAVWDFEYGLKRRIDVTKDETYPIQLQGLRKDLDRNFYDNRMFLNLDEWRRIFHGCLTGTSDLLLKQIRAARAKGLIVKKVVMIGGFAESPSLKSHIDKVLRDYNDENDTNIKRITTDTPSTAVAQGAILRSLRKEHCPDRIVQFSYGYKTDEQYASDHEDEEIQRAHTGAKYTCNVADEYPTIKDTIFWTIQKGDLLKPTFAYRWPTKFVFGQKDKKFNCEFEVYMLDRRGESHYAKTRKQNKGVQKVGCVRVDLTFMKEMEPTQVIRIDDNPSAPPKRVWTINVDVVVRVRGRSLTFEACWPPMSPVHGELMGEHPGTIKKRCELSIAGAFAHGTA